LQSKRAEEEKKANDAKQRGADAEKEADAKIASSRERARQAMANANITEQQLADYVEFKEKLRKAGANL
jgi:hypothetical protein